MFGIYVTSLFVFQGLGACFLIGKGKPTKIKTKENHEDEQKAKQYPNKQRVYCVSHRNLSNFKKQAAETHTIETRTKTELKNMFEQTLHK